MTPEERTFWTMLNATYQGELIGFELPISWSAPDYIIKVGYKLTFPPVLACLPGVVATVRRKGDYFCILHEQKNLTESKVLEICCPLAAKILSGEQNAQDFCAEWVRPHPIF